MQMHDMWYRLHFNACKSVARQDPCDLELGQESFMKKMNIEHGQEIYDVN